MGSRQAEIRRLQGAFEAGGIEALREALHGLTVTQGLATALVDALADAQCSVPASWCLRVLLEGGLELDRGQSAALCRSLAKIEAQDARLHVCQTASLIEVPARNAEAFARFLRSGCEGEHKLVRAWAMDAFQHLARQHGRFRAEALQWLDRGRKDPAASVRARARRIVAERR